MRLTGYFAPADLEHELCDELTGAGVRMSRRPHGRLVLSTGAARNMLCTIKFRGLTDHDIVREFAAIPGAHVLHLHHNKHELTFMWSA